MKKIRIYNELSNICIILLVFLNLLYPSTFTGLIFQTPLIIGVIVSFLTYIYLKKETREETDEMKLTLMRLNRIFQNLIFIFLVIIFIHREVLYNMVFLPMFIFFTGMYFGFILTYYTIEYYNKNK